VANQADQPPTINVKRNEYWPNAVMLCVWEVKAGKAHSICGCTHGWRVIPGKDVPYLNALEVSFLSIERYYTSVLFIYFIYKLSSSFNKIRKLNLV